MNKNEETKIPAKRLREIITGFRKIVPRHSEVLRQVKFDSATGLLSVTDGSAFLSHQLSLRTRPGSTCFLAFDALAHFAKGLPARQEILIEAGDRSITLSTAGRKCVAKPVKPADSFTSPPDFPGKAQAVTPEDREAILRAFTCASTDDTRPVLQGVFFDHEEATPQVVGTDGRSLYHETLRDLEIAQPFILPASPLLRWRGFHDDWLLKVGCPQKERTLIQLTAGPWTFTVPAIEGNYPNWRQVLPDLRTRPTRLSLGADDLAVLRQMNGDSIGFLSKRDEVRFVTFDKEADQWITHLAKDSTCQGPPSRVFMNPRFLKRALDAGATEACLAEEIDPVLFRGKGQLVVMPLRVSGPAIPGATSPPSESKTETKKTKKPKKPTASPPPKPMPKNNPSDNDSTPAKLAHESLKVLKGQLRESIGLIDQAMRHLREAQADQRATQKDIKTIRGTLQSLKKVAFQN